MKTNLAIPDNCTLIFTKEGLTMRVTLNIPKDLVKYTPKFYLGKGKKFNTFVLISEVTDCTYDGIHSKYNSMVRKAMGLVRYYKLGKLLKEIKMLITKKSILTGESRTLEIPIEPEDYREYLEGEPLDIVAPYLCDYDKKFILTGIIEEEDDNY